MDGKFIALAFAIIALASNAAAEGIQAQCGDESGRAFAVAQGVIRADQAGWYDDATHGETVIRIDTNTGEAEVRYKDATGIWQSVSDQGGSATLFGAQSEPTTFTVLVAYPGRTIEVLTIADIRRDHATLIHSLSRAMPALTNARVMTASCQMTAY